MMGDKGYDGKSKLKVADMIKPGSTAFCVTTGPFAHWSKGNSKRTFNGEWIGTQKNDKGKNYEECIMRAVGVFYNSDILFSPTDEMIYLNHNNYLQMKNGEPKAAARSIDLGHGLAHAFINGHMNIPSAKIGLSAYDPMFFLHHANVDRLFDLWQRMHNDYTSYDTKVESKDLLGFPLGDWTTVGKPDEPRPAIKFPVESVLRSSQLKLLPHDDVTFEVVYADTVKLEPTKTVISVKKQPTARRLRRGLSAVGERKVTVMNEEEEEEDEEEDAQPRLEFALKTAMCMAMQVYENNVDAFNKVPSTASLESQTQVIQQRKEVLQHMNEMQGLLTEGKEKATVELIEDLDAEESTLNPNVQTPRSALEAQLGFALDSMADAYFDLIYGDITTTRHDECLTHACGRICKGTTTSVKKKFGGDCRFYCQCERDVTQREMLQACEFGEIFTDGVCVKGDESKCVNDKFAVKPNPATYGTTSSNAERTSIVAMTSLALLSFFS